ncbi:hypothetical protein G6F46_014481 [Rhizopus delemar]|nr:hypothetical protein G6F46_014481 [Rhizopus delemar]
MIDAAGPQDDEERTLGVLAKAQILRDADRIQQAVSTLEAADQALPDTVEIKYELAMLSSRWIRTTPTPTTRWATPWPTTTSACPKHLTSSPRRLSSHRTIRSSWIAWAG